MLTADLVPVRRKNGSLCISPIDGKSYDLHLELAEQVMAIAADCEGMTREQLHSELASVGHLPAETKIVKGYAKLIEDALTFEEDRGARASVQRRAVFEAAAEAWLSLAPFKSFDRSAVLARVAQESAIEQQQLEDELFIDLPAAQRVISTVNWSPEMLVRRYDEGRIAAILLRAVSVTARFFVVSVLQVRDLLRALKFHRLLFELSRDDDDRYTLEISGPYSLFDSVTKYGLQLALCWPILSALPGVEVEADLRWGKQSEKLKFTYAPNGGKRTKKSTQSKDTLSSSPIVVNVPAEDETETVAELRQGLVSQLRSAKVTRGEVILDMPGVGLCVPDLSCHFENGATVHVEVLGFWSREAVWKRVELVESGLSEPVLFVVSSKLRVSEDVLDDEALSALYVFKGRINAASAAARISELAVRGAQPSRKRAKQPRK